MSVLKDNQLLKPKQTGCETLKQTGCETLKQTGCETLTSGPHHTSVVTSFCQIFLLSDIVFYLSLEVSFMALCKLDKLDEAYYCSGRIRNCCLAKWDMHVR